MKLYLHGRLLLAALACSTAIHAATVNASTSTYIASTDPYGSAQDTDTKSFDPALFPIVPTFSATSNFDGGSAYAWGYAALGVMGGLINSSEPTAVISQNADSQARSTFNVSDNATAVDGSLPTGTAFSKTFNIGIAGTSSAQPPCCIDELYVLATFVVYDLTTGGNQIVNLQYGVGPVGNGATSETVTLHVGDQLSLAYGIDMANYVSPLEPSVSTLFADYSNTFDFYVSGGDASGDVISTGHDYSEILPGVTPEPGTLALIILPLAAALFARQKLFRLLNRPAKLP